MPEDYYFKNRKEVEQFFKGEYFEFSFFSEGTLFFETLRPIFLGGQLFKFQLSFYTNYKSPKDFFKFSSFNDWLDKYQLAGVTKIDESDNTSEDLYFETFNEDYI